MSEFLHDDDDDHEHTHECPGCGGIWSHSTDCVAEAEYQTEYTCPDCIEKAEHD